MGIDIYTGSLRLLQQELQIPQVMAGNKDAGTAACTDIYPCDLRISIGFCVGFIQQSHSLYPIFSGLQGEGSQFLRREGIVQGSSQGTLQESIYFCVLLEQGICVLGVSGQSL